MENLKIIECPNCKTEIEKNSRTGKYPCTKCGKVYGKRAKCNVCGDELELLEACGAQQFFCNTCKELKSKRTAEFFIKEIEE